MGVLRDFERRLGGLVEGAFAKVSKGGVEPVKIAKALARETDHRRAIRQNRVLVPNEFAVELATSDYTRLKPYRDPLREELAAMVIEHAKEQRYTFTGPVRVSLAEAEDLDVGVFRIRSSVAAADPVALRRRRSAQPRRSLPGVPRLVITSASGDPTPGVDRDYPLEAETTVIGRSADCDIRLNDTGVSRQHGEVRRTKDGQFLYIDFNSTNGSIVNGRPVKQVTLVNGDRIELGGIILTFHREDSRPATTVASPPPLTMPQYRDISIYFRAFKLATPSPERPDPPKTPPAAAEFPTTVSLPVNIIQQPAADGPTPSVPPPTPHISPPPALRGEADPPLRETPPPPSTMPRLHPPPTPTAMPGEDADVRLPIFEAIMAAAESQPAAIRPRIFLCHSHGDKEAVRALYRRLRDDGFDPWFDEENLLPGQDWQLEISKAIKASRFVLACLSKSSVTKQGFVQKEIHVALDLADEQPEGSIFLIPVLLEPCDVPYRLSRLQWVYLFSSNGYDLLLRSLRHAAS